MERNLRSAGERLLLLDVGNSSVSCGVVRDGLFVERFSVAAVEGDLLDELRKRGSFDILVAASVNPPLWKAVERELGRLASSVLLVGRDVTVPIEIDLEAPEEVGADRLLNGLAAFERFGAAVVVDCGTAVTFDVVAPEGVYLGGAIAPGLNLTARALARWCALLPRIDPDSNPPLLGRNTHQAISSGLVHGLAAMVDGMIERYRSALDFDFVAIATGGQAHIIAPKTRYIDDFIPGLTLEGLLRTYRRHAGADA